MRSCTNCGYEVEPGDRYCRRCGAPAAGETAGAGLRCEGCGRTDPTLRFTYFLLVWSLVVVSFKRGVGARVLCAGCRSGRGLFYAALSLLLGPWGFPHGLIWTIQALVVNLRGGSMPAEANLQLLPALALTLYGLGRPAEAAAALEAALKIRDDPQLRQALTELRNSSLGGPKLW